MRMCATMARLCGLGVALVDAATVTISNVKPKVDVNGDLFDAHDGNTHQFEPGGPFYWFAMGYGTCLEEGDSAHGNCGQWSNNTVGVWRSQTLASGTWELLHSFTPSSSGWPKCTYYRSHVLRSATTGKYVLWLNAQKGTDNSCPFARSYVMGTADSPEGPYEYQGVVPGLRYQTEGGFGDFALFQDDDENRTAYVIYKRTGAAPGAMGHRMTLQRLRPDLAAADEAEDASAGIFGAPFVEAPVLFKRYGLYYALFGQCCAFCAHGSGIGVYTAASPLGPWTSHGNIGCAAQVPDGCGCATEVPAIYNTSCPKDIGAVTFAQQNSVILVGDDVVWTGDRWQSACASTVASQGLPATGLPRELDCVKAYDLQYWSVLRWDESRTPPLPRQVSWENEITINIPEPGQLQKPIFL